LLPVDEEAAAAGVAVRRGGGAREGCKGSGSGRIKMVTIVNPNNPTGVLLSREELLEIADICAQANAWLVRLQCTE
jgi:histidinol-phosphate/aromatic aminotransferase/cobyric acid decarboxylase-like protein